MFSGILIWFKVFKQIGVYICGKIMQQQIKLDQLSYLGSYNNSMCYLTVYYICSSNSYVG